MGQLGMDDVGTVNACATQLNEGAQQLATLASTVDQITAKLHAIWHGPNSDQFRAEWRGKHKPALDSTHDSLASLVTVVRKNLVAQVHTSDTLDGHTQVPGAIPPPALGGPGSGPDGSGGPGGPDGPNGPGGPDGSNSDGSGSGDSGTDSDPANIDHVSTNLTDGIHDVLDGKTGEDDKGVPADISAQQTLLDKTLIGANAAAHTHLAGMDADASANASIGANATASEHLKFGKDGMEASAGVAAFAGGSASVAAGLSNKYGSLKGDAGVTAGVQGEAEAKVGLTSKGLEAEAGAGGFVGAQAQAKGSVDVGGVGGSLGVHAYAGAGVHVGADADVNMHEVKIGVHVGAALGVGVGIDPSIDIHPDEIVHNATSVAKHAFGWL